MAAAGGLADFERRERFDALLEAEDADPESLSEPDVELLSLLESLFESVLPS